MVAVSPKARTLHELNETASFLWRLLEHPRTLLELEEHLVREFEVDAGEAARDVRDFGEALVELGLLEAA